MDSTLSLPNPLHVRPFAGDEPLAFTYVSDQRDSSSLGNGLSGNQHYGLPARTHMLGGAESASHCIAGTMADLDVSKFPLSVNCAVSRHISEYSSADEGGSSIVDPQLDSGKTSSRYTAGDTTPSELPSPYTKPGIVKKRGRPRKPRSAATVTGQAPGDAAIKSGRRASIKIEAMSSDPEDPKSLRTREKNRIAADKCRSRRRQQEEKLKFRHDDLEQKHRSLLDAQSELMGEIYILKNMMMDHSSCDCRLIQDYLARSASEWVAKKVEPSIPPVETSALRSGRCGNSLAFKTADA